MWKFLNTAQGSYFKVALAAVLGQMMYHMAVEGHTIFDIWTPDKLKGYGTVMATSLLPILINWLNPNDPRYGSKGKPSNFAPENNEIKE